MGLLGAHVSIGGGLEKSVQCGEELGCESIQIFSKNQRQWKAAPLSDESAALFRSHFQKSDIRSVVIHDSYLINLASPDIHMLNKSRDAFLDEMNRADQLDVPFLVFHPGSHMKTGEEAGLRCIVESLEHVLSKQPDGRVQLLLETTSGQGDHLGYCFEQLAKIISLVSRKDRLGVCYDTSHTFESGYDIRTERVYEETFEQFDRIIGLDLLKVFHLNDSKTDLGSRVDRHENIGEGFLGLEPFRFLVNDRRFVDHPMILETPGGDIFYKKNLELLRSLVG
ncbi:deoxyribonuclease IV [bacterium]|nr:deoxyribonuclease IV [bacterium]RQV98314.1 MAG: deoxyribonuclease IV [bacterium]